MSTLKKNSIRLMKASGAKTESKIRECALKLLTTKGFDTTSIEEITRAAGVSKGTFYVHFKSKYDLLPALTDSLDIDYASYSESLVGESDALAAFWSFTDIVLDTMEKFIGFDLLRVTYRAQIAGEVAIDPFIAKSRNLFKIYLNILERAKGEGLLREDVDCEAFSDHFVMAIRGMIFEWCTRSPNFDFRKEAMRHFEFLVNGITAAPVKSKFPVRKNKAGGKPPPIGAGKRRNARPH